MENIERIAAYVVWMENEKKKRQPKRCAYRLNDQRADMILFQRKLKE